MPIPPVFITVMSIFNERAYLSGFGRADDNFSTCFHLIKHVLLYVYGAYWIWFFARKVTRYIGSYIHDLFVPLTAKYIEASGSTINVNLNSLKSFCTWKSNCSFSQHIDNKRGVYTNKFVDSIIYLDRWTRLAGVKKITALSNAQNFSRTEELFSKNIIIELFTTHRSTRLQVLLHYLNDSVSNFSDSQGLAGALSTLIVLTIGFPQTFHINSSPKFRYIDSIMVDALRTSQDSLVFDFVLHYLVDPIAFETILFQDVDGHVKNTLTSKKYSTPTINAFFKPTIMLEAVPGIKNDLFGKKLRRYFMPRFQSIYSFYNTSQKDIYVDFFEIHTQDILSEIKNIHYLLQNHNNYYFNEETLLSTSTKVTDKAKFNFEKYDLIFVDPDVKIIFNTYNAKTFENDIIARRKHYTHIRSKIERLQTDINFDLYRKIYTHPNTVLCLDLLQKSHRALILKFKQYQDHISRYEKTFALYQVLKFVGAFKFEIENILQNISELDSRLNIDNLDNALKCFVYKSSRIVRNKDKMCKRFFSLDKTYRSNRHTRNIITLYNGLFEAAQTLLDAL